MGRQAQVKANTPEAGGKADTPVSGPVTASIVSLDVEAALAERAQIVQHLNVFDRSMIDATWRFVDNAAVPFVRLGTRVAHSTDRANLLLQLGASTMLAKRALPPSTSELLNLMEAEGEPLEGDPHNTKHGKVQLGRVFTALFQKYQWLSVPSEERIRKAIDEAGGVRKLSVDQFHKNKTDRMTQSQPAQLAQLRQVIREKAEADKIIAYMEEGKTSVEARALLQQQAEQERHRQATNALKARLTRLKEIKVAEFTAPKDDKSEVGSTSVKTDKNTWSVMPPEVVVSVPT